MRIIKKITIITMILSLSFIFVGCFNYKEISKITFATSVIFDRDEYNNIKIYLDCVRPYRNANESSDKGRRLIFESTGKTVLEAIRSINLMSSNEINFSQVKSYIFTVNAAKIGVEDYINIINNNQQFSFKPYMFIYFGDVNELLDIVNNEEEYIGVYLKELIDSNKQNSSVICKNVNEYLSDILENDRVSFMTGIELRKDDVDNKIKLNGGVIMKDNMMIDTIDTVDAVRYNLLIGKAGKGTLEVMNPEEEEKFVTLDILENSTYTEVSIDKTINIKKSISLITTIGEIQGPLSIDINKLRDIEEAEKQKVKDNLLEVYNEYKNKNIDLLNIKRLIKGKYPNFNFNQENYLKNVNLEIDLNLEIEGSSLVKDSLTNI